MTRPRRSAIVALLVAAGLLVAALLALRGAWSGPSAPPARVWTLDPLPSVAALRAAPRPPAADIRAEPGGSRVRGFDAFFAPRFGPKGGPELLWEIALLPSVSPADEFLRRFTDDSDVEARWSEAVERPPTYTDTGLTESHDGATWRAWDLRSRE